jgi:hypothetical protein
MESPCILPDSAGRLPACRDRLEANLPASVKIFRGKSERFASSSKKRPPQPGSFQNCESF